MAFLRRLTGTDMQVSALGLGTVKLGRNQSVKYPQGFTLPGDDEARNLLALARDIGINVLDTAPAYGNSEERLGQLMERRQDWVIVTKTGEEFHHGTSHFNFSGSHTRASVERSLERLRTDYLDIVLIHSDGNDEEILNNSECVDTLRKCQQEGLIRAIGMSSKTVNGGMQAVDLLDLVMITYNLEQQDQAVLDYARAKHCGVLIKKGLMSGHAGTEKNSLQKSMELLFASEGIDSVIVGTINPKHLKQNAELAKAVISGH